MRDARPRLLTEQEAADVLRGGGSANATAKTVRWLLQLPDAPKRDDFMVNLFEVAKYLRRRTGRDAPGLQGAAALFDAIVPKNARPRALTYAERQRKSRAKSNFADIKADIDRALAEVNWRSRHRAERDLAYFMRTYCMGEGGFLETRPPKAMLPIIRDMQTAVESSSVPFHIRQPRGTGKTAFVKCTTKWAAATGRRKYTVAVAANVENAQSIIDDVYEGMIANPAFVRDWPEVAIPFLRLAGAYQRAKTQTCGGEPTNCKKTTEKIVLPTIRDPRTGRPFQSSGVIIEAVGFSAGARGKAKMSQRPDFLFLDDLQNDDNAESDSQVQKIVRKVKRTFMGLAGHRKKIAAIMTSTPIEADDVSETFAKDRGWRTSTYKLLMSWPKCHDPAAKGAGNDLWEEYANKMEEAKLAGLDPNAAGCEFYKAHHAEMIEGAEVLNPDNFDAATEIDAVQHAMNLLFRDGLDSFMSEYQMQPTRESFAFEITPELIMSRVRRGTPPRTPQPGSVLTVAATDINPSYGLTTAIVDFDVNLTAMVVAYSVAKCKIPEDLNEVEFNRRVETELIKAGRDIAASGVKIARWGVDCGGRQFRAVTHFAPSSAELCGMEATPMLGRAGRNWNPNVRSRIRNAVNDTVLCRNPQNEKWLAWNADAYKERMHLAWATEPGVTGGLSLYDGRASHVKFAVQIANEKLVEKRKMSLAQSGGEERFVYRWKSKEPHDYGDCLAMCYALAAAANVTGDAKPKAKKRKRRVYNG